MGVKLIPVVELFFSNIEGVESPKSGPFWEYSQEYDKYNELCLKKLGYNPMKSIGEGSMFFPVSELTQNNIEKLVEKHFRELDVTHYINDELTAIDGGYILNINGINKLYPQCCCSLSDISCWIDLINNPNALDFMSSHPAPKAYFEGDNIMLDLAKTNSGEKFSPEPTELVLSIKKQDLQIALNEVYQILDRFANQIKSLNENYQLDKDSDLLWQKLIFDEE